MSSDPELDGWLDAAEDLIVRIRNRINTRIPATLGSDGSGGGLSFPIGPGMSAPILDLVDASDTGVSATDNYTTDTTPTFDAQFITMLLAGDLVVLLRNNTIAAQHTVTAGEAAGDPISLTLGVLGDGTHNFKLYHGRTGVGYSPPSTVLTVIIDNVAPTLTSPTGVEFTSTTATVSVSTDDNNGTVYCVVTASATTPSKAQIKAGQDHTGAAALGTGTKVVSAIGVQTFTATVSTLGTRYAHFMHEDLAGNQSNAVSSASWNQADITAPVLSSPTGASTGATTASLGVSTTDADGTLYWIVSKLSSAPSIAQITAGQGSDGIAAEAAGNQAVSASGAQAANATGLTLSTTYYAHFFHRDAASNNSNIVTSASFTTTATATLNFVDYFQNFTATYDHNTDSFTAISIGASQAGDKLVIVPYFAATAFAAPLDSVTCNLSNMTNIFGAGGSSASQRQTDIAYIVVPGSTTSIDLVFNNHGNGSAGVQCAVYWADSANPTPTSSDVKPYQLVAPGHLVANVTVPANGFSVGVGINADGTLANDILTGITVDGAGETNTTHGSFKAGHSTTAGAEAVDVTGTGGGYFISVAAATWGP